MSSISDFVSAAGPSGVTFVVLSTTTFVINLGMKALSAEGKVAALRKLLNRTKGAHLEVKANLLSTIPPDFHHDPAFANMDRRSHVLDIFSSQLTELEDKLSSAGIWKWSPLYLGEEILLLSGALAKAHKDTAHTTRVANNIILEKGILAQRESRAWMNPSPQIVDPVRKQVKAADSGDNPTQNANDGGNQNANDVVRSSQDANDGCDSDQDVNEEIEIYQVDKPLVLASTGF